MDKDKTLRYAEGRLLQYRKRLRSRGDHLPEDISRGLIHLNRDLFETGSTVGAVKEKNKTPQNNFSTRFKRYVGMSPRDYLTHHRIEAAKMLLGDEKLKELSTDEIGWLVGYEKPQTFVMAFKSKTGLPPGKWRDKQLNREKS